MHKLRIQKNDFILCGCNLGVVCSRAGSAGGITINLLLFSIYKLSFSKEENVKAVLLLPSEKTIAISYELILSGESA